MGQARTTGVMEGRRLWLAWVAANATAEMLGLGLAFAAGIGLVQWLGEPASTAGVLAMLAAALALGAAEGLIVGFAQWTVLRRRISAVSARSWIMATVVGAVLAWFLGMLPATFASLDPASPPPPEPPESLVLILSSLMGMVAGLILSGAQWYVLRRRAAGANWWLPANALAWALGLPWIFWLVGSTVAESLAPASIVLFGSGLALSGALVGSVHGAFLCRVIPPLLPAGGGPPESGGRPDWDRRG